jgi:hypothetical protein
MKDYRENNRLRIRTLTRAIRRKPTSLAYFKRSFSYACLQKYPEAIADAELSLNTYPIFVGTKNYFPILKREYIFFKKGQKIKRYLDKLKENGNLKIDKRRIRKNGDVMYFYLDNKGKRVLYNITQDKLEEFDGEFWV